MYATTDKIGWKVAKLSLNVASVRYRALLPVLALQEAGQKCHVFADYDPRNLEGLSVLVIVKGLVSEDLELALAARARGIAIVLDLCDCIFVNGYGGSNYRVPPSETFLAMARLASAIVVPTESLAEIVRQQAGPRTPVFVIPDGVDSSELQSQALQVLDQSIAAAKKFEIVTTQAGKPQNSKAEPQHPVWTKVRKKISRKYKKILTAVRTEGYGALARKHFAKVKKAFGKLTKPKTEPAMIKSQPVAGTSLPATITTCTAKRIVWFGNHGAPYARFGMLDLLDIKDSLEQMATEMDVKLIVISDNIDKYNQFIKPLKIPSEYIAWNPTVVEREFAKASVVVIPNPLETFSICKSANRAVLALKHGVPVVATETPALRPLAECIVLDDFENGLRTYLTDSSKAKKDVARGGQLIHELYGQPQTRVAWNRVIALASDRARTVQQAA